MTTWTTITDKDFAIGTYLAGSERDSDAVLVLKPDVLFKYGLMLNSDVVIKYGSRVRASEVETMEFIRTTFADIPVPQVHSFWTAPDGRGYIAMSLLPGKLLHQEWPSMGPAAKESVLRDYRTIVSKLRSPRPPPGTKIGGIDGHSPAVDNRCSDTAFATGPCDTEAGFNEFLLSYLDPLASDFQRETVKACMKTDHELRFTHADLGPHNVLVETKNGRTSITGVLDWEFSGWYPEYWEYVKMGHFGTAHCDFLWNARRFWGEGVLYDQELVNDDMLDRYLRHGQRVIKRVRFG